MNGFIISLCIIILVLFINIICKKQDITYLETKIRSYEDREKSISEREKESEIAISKKQKEADADFKAKMLEIEKCQQGIELRQRYLDIQSKTITERESILELTKSNLSAIPYMAGIIADFETHGFDILARKLDWGYNQERAKKVISIREIRKKAEEQIAQSKEAQYQLDYAIKMFPALADFLETDYRQLPVLDISDFEKTEHDCVRDYLSRDEYDSLSSIERNQLALDRYRESHRKTNWQIGRDYELYVGYMYTKKGYEIDYFGSNMGLNDLGRDLIAKKDKKTLIIQCKYWSSKKLIHENHINQLYGTVVCYCLEQNIPVENVQGMIVTNITLSDTAKRFANYLGITFVENFPLGNYPCIKCNINRSQFGEVTKIYHLPFDQQYDSCKVNSPGEFFAMTVAEAEEAGFRRAFRWHGDNG